MNSMHKFIILLMIISAVTLQGCSTMSDSSKKETSGLESSTATRNDVPEKEDDYEMNAELVKAIMDKVNCTEEQARRVDARLGKLGITDIVEIESAKAEDNSIMMTTGNGKKYEIGIDKIWRVYSVKDIEQDKYLFAIYE